MEFLKLSTFKVDDICMWARPQCLSIIFYVPRKTEDFVCPAGYLDDPKGNDYGGRLVTGVEIERKKIQHLIFEGVDYQGNSVNLQGKCRDWVIYGRGKVEMSLDLSVFPENRKFLKKLTSCGFKEKAS